MVDKLQNVIIKLQNIIIKLQNVIDQETKMEEV